MLDQPLTVGNLLAINLVSVLPILALLGKAVWYLAKMTHQHDQMWTWFNGLRGDRRSTPERRAAYLPLDGGDGE